MTRANPTTFGGQVYLNLVNHHVITTEFSIPEAAALLTKPVWFLRYFAQEGESLASAARRFHRDVTSFGVEVPHVISQTFESTVSGELKDASDLAIYFRTIADVMIQGVSSAAGLVKNEQEQEYDKPKNLKKLSDQLREKLKVDHEEPLWALDSYWEGIFTIAWNKLEKAWPESKLNVVKQIYLANSKRTNAEIGKICSIDADKVSRIKNGFLFQLERIVRNELRIWSSLPGR